MSDTADPSLITSWYSSAWNAGAREESADVKGPYGPHHTMRAFFDWQFDANQFEFAIFLPAPPLFSLGRDGLLWPQVVPSAAQARLKPDTLIDAAVRGWTLVVATRSATAQLGDFFSQYGYDHMGDAPCGSRNQFDAVGGHQFLNIAVPLAARIGAVRLCAFAHDCDPVFFLSQGAESTAQAP